MTRDEFYAELDRRFDAGNRPEELLKWLREFCEKTRCEGEGGCAADGAAELHIACTSELAAFCRGISDYEASVRYYEEVLEALLSTFGERSLEYAVTVNNLAGTCRQMGELRRAEELFLKAKKLFEERGCGGGNGPHSALGGGDSGGSEAPGNGEAQFLYASVLNNLGLLYMDSSREEEGLAFMARSMAILEALGGHEADVATGLLNQAYYHAAKNQDEKAMALLSKAMRIFSELPYRNPHEISAKMLNGQLLSRAGEEAAAEDCLLRVLEELEAVFGRNKDYGIALQSLASHCRRYGRGEEAAEYENEAAVLLGKLSGKQRLSSVVQEERNG